MNSPPKPDQIAAAAVLSVILDGRHADSFARASLIIDHPDAMTDRTHRMAWLACQRLMDSGQRIDAGSVAQELASIRYADAVELIRPGIRKAAVRAEVDAAGIQYEDSALAAVGGMTGISDLTLAMGHAASLEANCRIVAEHHRCRALVAVLEEQRKALEAPDGVKRTTVIGEQIINACACLLGEGRTTTDLGAAISAAGVAHDAAQKSERSAAACWGIPILDHALTLDPARLVVLAAPRSCGKTSLALQAIDATAREHGRGSVAVVSLEMPAVELATILAGRAISVPAKAIRNGLLTTAQRQALDNLAREQTESRAVSIKDAAFATNIDAICAWCRQQQAMSGRRLRLLVVDHLQAMSAANPRHTEYQRISEATGKLKALALELGICVLALSQLSRAGTRQDRDKTGGLDQVPPEPQLADLRGSGTIEQDADAVVMLWPRQALTAPTINVTAKVAKHRSGEPTSVDLEWSRSQGQVFRAAAAPRRQDADDPEREKRAEQHAEWMTRGTPCA